ncbi:MAG: serine--tRNA ligase [Micavibrio sp.]|nr:serine--tRNA ligase [Micavibrio sp.]
MHDIKYIRENPEAFDKAMDLRGFDESQSANILALDEKKRGFETELQGLQSARNAKSKEIGKIKSQGGDADVIMAEVASMKEQMAQLEAAMSEAEEAVKTALASLPNILADDVPEGADEADNVEVRTYGEPRKDHKIEHFEIGEKLGLMDFETAAKMSGSRFTLLSGGLARMERALAQYFLDMHTMEHGYTEVSPPLLVRNRALYGTGQLPKFGEDLYHATSKTESINRAIEALENKMDIKGVLGYLSEYQELLERKEEHYLIPTAEVPLTNIVADQIVDEEYLPRRYTAFTPCFRSEAGSAGRDTRGMLRQHQFYKVEMVSVTTPEESEAEHERMLGCAEAVLKGLEIPFCTVKLCSGDTGFGATKTYDIEAWLPGQEAYREISSVSNCRDFQARRMNARVQAKGDKSSRRFVHTLNGSGVAVGRALIAVMENYYDPADGGVFVPDVLKPYMGEVEKILPSA